MLDSNKIAVISTGNGGQSMAAYFTSIGYKVALYAREQERVDMFRTHRFVVSGAVNGMYYVETISCDMEDILDGAHLIMVTTPAQYHSIVARDMAPYLKDGQVILLNPGRTFGTFEFDTILKNYGCTADYILGEAETFAFTCRCNQVGYPTIYSIKDRVLAAAHDKSRTGELIDVVTKALPCFVPADNVFHTGLSNLGMIFHPMPFIMNLVRIEKSEQFLYYKEGITPMVAERLEELDAERIEIAKALDVNIPNAKEWLAEKYGSSGNNLYEAIQNTEAYSQVYAPTNIYSRYVFEDIPTGCVPLYCAGQRLGVKTQMIKAVIDWATSIYGFDFMARGRNESKMDLSQITR